MSVGDPALEERTAAVLGVAGHFRTGVPLTELLGLLPEPAPGSVEELKEWLKERPHVGYAREDRAFAPSVEGACDPGRTDRGARWIRAAEAVVHGPLAPVRGLTECIGLSGSVAFGEPEAGDDVDFYTVTRPGALWIFLLYTYLRLRLDRPRLGFEPCFNYVVEDPRARREMREPRGFLVAREALSVRPLSGRDYYRQLLGEARWMAEEVPRRYPGLAEPKAGLPAPRPVPPLLRALNLALFPVLAAYLQLVAVYRNHRLGASAGPAARFRTFTERDRVGFASEKFEALRLAYARAGGDAPVGPEPGGRTAPPDPPGERAA